MAAFGHSLPIVGSAFLFPTATGKLREAEALQANRRYWAIQRLECDNTADTTKLFTMSCDSGSPGPWSSRNPEIKNPAVDPLVLMVSMAYCPIHSSHSTGHIFD